MKEVRKYYKPMGELRVLTELYYLDEVSRLQGEYTRWYDNRTMCIKNNYVDDKNHGEYKSWHRTGKLKEHSMWFAGDLHGEFKAWNSDGRLSGRYFFRNGIDITKEVAPYRDNSVMIKLKFDIPLLPETISECYAN